MDWSSFSSMFGSGGGAAGGLSPSSHASNTNNFGGLSTINPIVLAIGLLVLGAIALALIPKK